jgi:hypothetical protein
VFSFCPPKEFAYWFFHCILFSTRKGEKRIEMRELLGLFVSASGSFWPPKAAADYQTLSFSANFYKIR